MPAIRIKQELRYGLLKIGLRVDTSEIQRICSKKRGMSRGSKGVKGIMEYVARVPWGHAGRLRVSPGSKGASKGSQKS